MDAFNRQGASGDLRFSFLRGASSHSFQVDYSKHLHNTRNRNGILRAAGNLGRPCSFNPDRHDDDLRQSRDRQVDMLAPESPVPQISQRSSSVFPARARGEKTAWNIKFINKLPF